MSKLKKFMSSVSFAEAADLLAGLINEPVSVDDLWQLHVDEWVPATYPINAEIYRLEPELEKAEHDMYVAAGRYFMKPAELVGICLGVQFPCDYVYLNSEPAFVLRDAEGGFYGLKDSDRELFLGPSFHGINDPEKFTIEPKDIFEIAGAANNPLEMPTRRDPARQCSACFATGIELFNLPPSRESARPKKQDLSAFEKDTPSKNLVIAALLEILTDTGASAKRMNQSGVVAEIGERFRDVWGLKPSTLNNLFAEANKSLKEARKAVSH
nr:hypothetical protein [Pseudomonas oryzihabitans]